MGVGGGFLCFVGKSFNGDISIIINNVLTRKRGEHVGERESVCVYMHRCV